MEQWTLIIFVSVSATCLCSPVSSSSVRSLVLLLFLHFYAGPETDSSALPPQGSTNKSSLFAIPSLTPTPPPFPMSQMEVLVCWLTKSPQEECCMCPMMTFFCTPRSTSYVLLHLISLSFRLHTSRINITVPFSLRNIKQSGGSISAHHQAAEQKQLYNQSISLKSLLYFESYHITI